MQGKPDKSLEVFLRRVHRLSAYRFTKANPNNQEDKC